MHYRNAKTCPNLVKFARDNFRIPDRFNDAENDIRLILT